MKLPRQDDKSNSIIIQFFNFLIEPSAKIIAPEERRQARLLSAFLLVIFFATAWNTFSPNLPEFRRYTVGIVFLGSIITYIIHRTKFFWLAGYMIVFLMMLPPFVNVFNGFDPSNVLRWLIMAILTGGLWLSVRGFIGVFSFVILGVLSLLKFIPEITYLQLGETVVFITITSFLILVATIIRTKAHKLIQQQNSELHQHKNNLENLVEERTSELQSSNSNLHFALQEVEELKDQLQEENIYLKEEIKLGHNFEEIISQSAKMKKVLKKVEQVSKERTSVLILGETGTGKELITRAIHNISNRRDRSLVKVNCAALPANLIESELFGHEKGAFTGAHARKVGRFELADGGTLFLDEIGELPIDLQPKLLRVLQEGEFESLGNLKTQKVDVRVLAATNRAF